MVSGYAGGAIVIHRGNLDSIYPNAPEARANRERAKSLLGGADEDFTPLPFLPEAQMLRVPAAAEFIGVGDFDADGLLDIVVTARGQKALYWLRGDGKGQFESPQQAATS